MLTFFLVPFAFRGARMAVRGMRNDVRDWLPEDFAETKELEWFRDNFVTEAFVLVSWDGCRGACTPFPQGPIPFLGPIGSDDPANKA